MCEDDGNPFPDTEKSQGVNQVAEEWEMGVCDSG